MRGNWVFRSNMFGSSIKSTHLFDDHFHLNSILLNVFISWDWGMGQRSTTKWMIPDNSLNFDKIPYFFKNRHVWRDTFSLCEVLSVFFILFSYLYDLANVYFLKLKKLIFVLQNHNTLLHRRTLPFTWCYEELFVVIKINIGLIIIINLNIKICKLLEINNFIIY